ncbi:hypothetical protein [Cerasicoccus frondis]|uniref:hypothetical protein n=1 Tax=Cerasicoccus frondis TaxID=490090 RepID=UPI002852B579|nr:hypothetical protein [Cerasicoccus frondis]
MAAKEAKRQAETPNVTVLQRRQISLGGGQTLTIEKASGANLPQWPTKPDAPEMTEEQKVALQAEMDAIKTISASVWVYDGRVSRIHWQHNDQTYIAWIPADLNLCRTIRDFSVGEQQYQLSLFLQNEDTKLLEERRKAALREGVDLNLPQIPELPASSSGLTEYFVESDDPTILNNADAFEGIEALLSFMDTNKADLTAALHRQTALSKAQKRYEAVHPDTSERKITFISNEQ